MQRHLAERSAGRIETFMADWQMVCGLREKVAAMIHARSGSRIAFAVNTSDALNVIATGMRWKAGDRIVLNDAEFPANVYPFLSARSSGAEIDILKTRDGVVTPDEILRLITPKTRLVAISAVQFLSGFKADLASIGELCRSRKIVFVVDAIQAVGAVEIDVHRMKIDALCAGAQKWQMGPHGTGFLYVSDELQEMLEQAYIGWRSVKDPFDFFNYEQPLHPDAMRYEGGTVNFPGLWGMDAAITTLMEYGVDAISRHVLALNDLLIERLDTLGKFDLMTPRDHARRGGILTFRTRNGADAAALFNSLESRNICISIRQGALRVSPHFYNSPDEIETLAEALRQFVS
jgi:cysteine desulfurase / selenocysteine lyase